MPRIVIAIGGNAILNPAEGNPIEQQRMIDQTCREIAQIVQNGYEVVLSHGNGPQIGNILAMQEECGTVQPQPLDVCGAQTQGMLGYLLQQSLDNRLKEQGIRKQVVTIVTRVIVDSSTQKPTKPIGIYYPEFKARKMIKRGVTMIKDKKGYRRVVSSPVPLQIVEEAVIKDLVSKGVIVIAGGGGGIPVIQTDSSLSGVEAVIDKDLTGSVLALAVGAEFLLILTDVEKAFLNYGKENQKALDEITISEAERYIEEGHFGKGSMEPKVLAALGFVKAGGRAAIISSLDKALPALGGETGTRVVA